jgi:hypothetical protein
MPHPVPRNRAGSPSAPRGPRRRMNRRGPLRATVNVTSSDGLVSMELVLPLIRWVGEGGAGDDPG